MTHDVLHQKSPNGLNAQIGVLSQSGDKGGRLVNVATVDDCVVYLVAEKTAQSIDGPVHW